MNRILHTGKLNTPYIDEFTVTSPIEECVSLLEEGASQSRWLRVRDYHIHITKSNITDYTFKMRTLVNSTGSKFRYHIDIVGTLRKGLNDTYVYFESQNTAFIRHFMKFMPPALVSVTGFGIVTSTIGAIEGLPGYSSGLALFVFGLIFGLIILYQARQKALSARIEAANLLRYVLHD